jgi:anti-anti-sigma regulatory factor
MAFRIERLVAGDDLVVLRVSGRIHAKHVDTLRELLGREAGTVVVDLREVTLIDREAVSFLALSEAKGVELRNCAAYIREWVDRERLRNDADRGSSQAGREDDI